MRRFVLAIVLVAAIAGPARAAPNDAEARYQSLLATAKAGAQPVDWQALRFAYADRPTFNVMDRSLDAIRTKMLAARKAGDFTEMLNQANQLIEQDYVDGQAHLMAGTALLALNQKEAGQREHDISIAIFKSIQTGDGLTPATAFTVIAIREEYELMSARQRSVSRQSLQNKDGHAYDVLETTGRDGDAVTFYFLVDRVLKAEAAMFQPKG